MSPIYDFVLTDAHGRNVPLADFRGKVLLIVNTATRCGLTPQYAALQQLYADYRAQGLEILDFPCNQFRAQAPESGRDIAQICQTKFGTEFTLFDKIEVNGPNTHPLYGYLKARQPADQSTHRFKDLLLRLAAVGGQRESGDIQWNFTKFLVDRNGEVVARYAPSVTPEEITADIRALL